MMSDVVHVVRYKTHSKECFKEFPDFRKAAGFYNSCVSSSTVDQVSWHVKDGDKPEEFLEEWPEDDIEDMFYNEP